MDTTDPDIVFDELGNCNHCNMYYNSIQKKTYSGKESDEQLDILVREIKSKSKDNKYDCLVGISGGVDSCYTAYLCKKLGLNPLLMHLDNGWDSDIAVKNIQTIAKNLDLDYISYVLNWQEFKEIQLAFLKSSIVDLEIPTDLAIPASLFETAKQQKIKFIISGGNYTSEGILPLQWGYHVMKDMKLYKHIVKTFSKVNLKHTPADSILKESVYRLVYGIKIKYILNYVNYDKDAAKELLQKELGWQNYGGKHHESRFTRFWQSYILPKKFNIDYRKATYSTQICAGQMTRVEALEKLKEPLYDANLLEDDTKYFCKKLGISTSEFEIIMRAKPLTFISFPNNYDKILKIRAYYKRLFSLPH